MSSNIKKRGFNRDCWNKKQELKRSIDGADIPLGSRAIPLTGGKYTLVDESDYDFINQWHWRVEGGYAIRSRNSNEASLKKPKRILMHRVILNTPDGMATDHINGNPLDNRRCNLRICTKSENNKNRKPNYKSTSKYKGVTRSHESKKWRVQLGMNGKNLHIGLFESEDDAARAYNLAAIKHYGEFASINVINGEEYGYNANSR